MSEKSKSNPSSEPTQAKTQVEEPSFEPTGIMLSREAFQKDYAMVVGETTIKVRVASVSREIPVLDGNKEQVFDRTTGAELFKRIINLKAIPSRHFAKVKELWGKRTEIDLGELRGLTMSINAIVPQTGELDIPMKNSLVQIQTQYLTDDEEEDGYRKDDLGRKILVVRDYAVPAIAVAPQFVLDDLEIAEEV